MSLTLITMLAGLAAMRPFLRFVGQRTSDQPMPDLREVYRT